MTHEGSPAGMQILSLIDDVDQLPALARLHHDEWNRVSPFKTPAQHARKLRARIGRQPVPATYVLLVESSIAGSVSLLVHDDIASVRPDLSPWLASLLVSPKYRGQGYGRALVEHCVAQARTLGFPALYLYTESHRTLYARLGWQVIEESASRGTDIAVMTLALDPPEVDTGS